MDKNMILESMYKAVKDSLEWGVGDEKYGYFVDGIVSVTEAMLEELELAYKQRIAALESLSSCCTKEYTDDVTA